jgi:hypothetical protein
VLAPGATFAPMVPGDRTPGSPGVVCQGGKPVAVDHVVDHRAQIISRLDAIAKRLALADRAADLLTSRPLRFCAPEPIYYCATGVEMPAFEPCKEMKD